VAPVCIIAPSSLRYMPYLRYYEDVLTAAHTSYDVLLWDRFGTGESGPNVHAYQNATKAGGAALLPAYLGYRHYLMRHLRAHSYDMHIVLGTQLAVLLYDYLRSRPFVVDIRDYSHEGLLPYRTAAFDLLRRARLVCISSRGFLQWLPPNLDYVMSHNVSRNLLGRAAAPFDPSRKVLSYIGAVGYYDANARFLDGASRNSDWEIRYIGRGTCEAQLESYCRSRGISNVVFRGPFRPEEKAGLVDQANFILGIYGNDSPVVRTAIPNRLYEACLHRRPIVVNSGTHLADLVKTRGLGAVVDLRDSGGWGVAVDRFYEANHYAEYAANAARFLEDVRNETAVFDKRVSSAVVDSWGVT
jgi:hypothetical protein